MRLYVLQNFTYEDRTGVWLFETRRGLHEHLMREDLGHLTEVHSGRPAWNEFLEWNEKERLEFWDGDYQTQWSMEVQHTIP